MNLEIQHRDLASGSTVVELRGKLMLGPSMKLLEDLIPQLVAAGRTSVVFDLSGLTQIDSTGIGRFIDAYHQLEKAGGNMVLAGAGGAVRDLFRITRLDTVFKLTPSVE